MNGQQNILRKYLKMNDLLADLADYEVKIVENLEKITRPKKFLLNKLSKLSNLMKKEYI